MRSAGRCWSYSVDSPEAAKLCVGCGIRLMPSCPACGALIGDTPFEALLKTSGAGCIGGARIRDPGVGLRTA